MNCKSCLKETDYFQFAKNREGNITEYCWDCTFGTKEKKEEKEGKFCLICKNAVGYHRKIYCKDCAPNHIEGRDSIRMKVRIRDNFTCQHCLKKWEKGMRQFDVHHLDELKASRKYDSKENIGKLITLCHKCHLTLHFKYGKTIMVEDKFKTSPGLIPMSEFPFFKSNEVFHRA